MALAAVTRAPLAGQSMVLELTTAHGPVSYDAVARAGVGETAARIAALAAETFGVPLPHDVALHVYPTERALARGLVQEIGITPAVAVELAGSAIGLAGPRAVFLLTDGYEEDGVRLVAHELMHVIQHELAGPAARPAQWMMEGTAEWAALTLMARLGAPGVGERALAARAAARGYLAADPGFSPAAVRRASDFRRWQDRVGGVLAYQVVYAMADALVARHGLPAVVTYFRAFRDGDDHAKNFERAFGAMTAQFAVDARARLAAARALATS